MMECRELAGKVIQTLMLYGEGDYGPEVNIEDGTVFNACPRTEPLIEAKYTCCGDGPPRELHDYSCPLHAR